MMDGIFSAERDMPIDERRERAWREFVTEAKTCWINRVERLWDDPRLEDCPSAPPEYCWPAVEGRFEDWSSREDPMLVGTPKEMARYAVADIIMTLGGEQVMRERIWRHNQTASIA